ncbi:MAG: phosphate ABC transporter permease PstA [Thermoanaerobacterales bacterium]|jgi:phosphate transport system permease protein|nr:phosphate ABC transporter permease PstA [Thermoanaerobacterales bacterium]
MALTTISSSTGAVRGSVERALRGARVDVRGRLFEAALLACLLLSMLVLGVLLHTVVTDGMPVYTERGWEFLDGALSSSASRAGISQGIVGSFWIAAGVVVLAVPVGVGAAIYLEEYAPRNRLTAFIELNVRNLAGVPSVVYGLLGLAIFVEALGGFSGQSDVDRRTLAAAAATLAVLVLPIVVITTAEAIRAVPRSLREGAYGVGATRWEVVRTQVLPYAAPGILTGCLLSIARAVGEAAPLIVVGAVTGFLSRGAGLSVSNVVDPGHLTERFVALPTIVSHWAKLPEEEFKVANSSAAILAMLAFVLLVNTLAIVLRNRVERKRST